MHFKETTDGQNHMTTRRLTMVSLAQRWRTNTLQESPAIADKPARRLKSGPRVHSKASKVTPFDSLHMVSYDRPTVLCV